MNRPGQNEQMRAAARAEAKRERRSIRFHDLWAVALIVAVVVVAATRIYYLDRVTEMDWMRDGSKPPVMLQPCTDETLDGCGELNWLGTTGYAAAPLEICNCVTGLQCGYRDIGGFECEMGNE